MSTKSERVCDRCEKSSPVHLAMDWPIVVFMSEPNQNTEPGHICQDCLPAVAALFPKLALDRFARHVDVIEMNSAERILPGMTVAIINKAGQHPTFEITRFVIGERAADWAIQDIIINRRSQFSHAGEVPGDLFAPDTEDNHLSFEHVPSFGDVEIRARYIGKNPEGARFQSKMHIVAPGFAKKATPIA